MILLGSVARSRDNNFNLIRMVAASSVLVSHTWPLTYGSGTPEPLLALTGHTLGTLAVYIFFVISGFLITASFERSQRIERFLWARSLRLFPGLAVSLLLVALALGPCVTTLPVMEYLTHPRTWRFLVANVTLVFPQYTLPAVFETNPFPAVEGSIWTLIHEVACYFMVLCAGLCGLFRGWRIGLFISVYALGWASTLLLPDLLPERLETLQALSLPFFGGMLGWLGRDRIPLTIWIVVGLGGLWAALRETSAAFPVLVLLIAYATAWLAYVPGGWVRRYNRLGDYSYGVYIYAFPLQSLTVWIFGPLLPVQHIALAFPLTFLLAVLSWHMIERPALALIRQPPLKG